MLVEKGGRVSDYVCMVEVGRENLSQPKLYFLVPKAKAWYSLEKKTTLITSSGPLHTGAQSNYLIRIQSQASSLPRRRGIMKLSRIQTPHLMTRKSKVFFHLITGKCVAGSPSLS